MAVFIRLSNLSRVTSGFPALFVRPQPFGSSFNARCNTFFFFVPPVTRRVAPSFAIHQLRQQQIEQIERLITQLFFASLSPRCFPFHPDSQTRQHSFYDQENRFSTGAKAQNHKPQQKQNSTHSRAETRNDRPQQSAVTPLERHKDDAMTKRALEKLNCDQSSSDYAILELQNGSSAEEVREAYKRLSRKYHPDRNQGQSEDEQKLAQAVFILVAEAYTRLQPN
jgi:hypothetical protein